MRRRRPVFQSYHSLLPPPNQPHLFPAQLAQQRQAYTTLRERYLIAPDGRWASDCSPPLHLSPSSVSLPNHRLSPAAAPSPTAGSSSGGWDPLSLDTTSPWKTWFAHLELRGTIRQDVERTFPDMEYFMDEGVRKSMVACLFLWSVENPEVGYRQVSRSCC